MDSLQFKLCDIQGRLFELSFDAGLDSATFIKTFMNSEVAKNLDSIYNRMQWCGEEYLLEELLAYNQIPISTKLYSKEVLFWTGYLYRYWHFLTGEDSRKIYKQASAETMKRNFMIFHTMDPEIAIEDLKEVYRQRSKSKS